MKKHIAPLLHRSLLSRLGWGLILSLIGGSAAHAQTVSGSCSVRFPVELPFMNGRPEMQSVPIMAGGNVGGVSASNNLGATNLILKSSIFGHNIEHLKPDAYLGQPLSPPVFTNGATVAWAEMTNTSLISPAQNAFFEPSVKTVYAAAGGEVVVKWKLTSGATVETTYVVESAPAGRPYRVYWTDRGAPKVQLGNSFVRFHYNTQITAPKYAVTTNVNGIVSSNVTAGLYIDNSSSLNAVGGQQGMIVMQYFKNGMYSEQVSPDSVIVIEVMPPDNQTLPAYLGERILPQGGWSAADELIPEITAGLMGDNTYLYQHTSSDGANIPKKDWIFPIWRSVDDPWNIEIYWKVKDLMGTEWFYEVDDYAADWPPCYQYVRGDGNNLGAPIYFPSNMTPSLMIYQEPDSGCATLQNFSTLITTTNSGRCLVQLTSQDENVWFLPIELTPRTNPNFDLNPIDWMISREIQPYATARSIMFPKDEGAQAVLASSGMTLASNFTLECWVMAGNLDAQTNATMTIFDKNTWGGSSWSNQVRLSIQTGLTDGNPGVLAATMGSGLPGQPLLATMTSTNRIYSYRWSHVALTLQNRTLSLYVDGSLGCKTQLATNGVRQTNSSPIFLGAATGTNSASLEGFIDNFRIWDVALSQDQVLMSIQGNYHGLSLSALTNQGLKAYFPIDSHDTISTLHDLVGRFSGTATNHCFLPDVGAVGMSDSAAFSAWHGYIYEPYGTSYNTNLYLYPTAAFPNAETLIFGVNTNTDLEVWWSRKIQYAGMADPVYIPSWVERYRNVWPSLSESPHIVLASGEGSKQGGIFEKGFCVALTNSGPQGSVMLRKDVYFNGDFTVGVWINLNSLPVSTNKAPIFEVSNVSTDGAHRLDGVYMTVNSTGAVELCTEAGSTLGSLSGYIPSPTGRWVYVMATLDGSTASLYVDSKLVATQAGMPIPQRVIRTNCLIGADILSDPFHGRIDEFRIWSTMLNAQQREAAMYDDELGLNAAALTTYFSFDPFKGNLIQDLVTGYKALVINGLLQEPGAPAAGTRLYALSEQASIYYQNNSAVPGFNPNEEHAIINRENGFDVVYAFRDDLNLAFHQSEPFVLVDYIDPSTRRPAMDALRIVRTSEVYQVFQDATLAGSALEGPHPLDLLPGHWTGTDYKESGPAWRARNNTWYGLAGGANPTDTAAVVMHNYYPMQPGFWFPGVASNLQPAVGTPIPWLPALTTQEYQRSNYPTNGAPVPVHWTLSWPEAIPVMDVGDTLTTARDGLPDIWNQKSVEVVYQQSTYADTNQTSNSVFLFDPICSRSVTLSNTLEEFGFTTVGTSPTIYLRNGYYYFYNLPPDLSERVYFNPNIQQNNLILKGQYQSTLTGYGYLLVNELSPQQRALLSSFVPTNNPHSADWARAIGSLAVDNVKLAPNDPFSAIALHTPGDGAGYVALAFNNATNPALGVSAGTPISLSVIKVSSNLATGTVIPLEDPYNLVSEQMSMRHNLDFAGEPGNFEFEWRWTEPNTDGSTPTDPFACAIYTNGVGLNTLMLDGKSPQDLLNRFFALRYRARTNTVAHVVGTNWSAFTSFSLAEGWVQRILNAITPFEQRMRDLYNNEAETQVSMISQAGPPYEGNVALNQDNLNNVGLIQLYKTVQNIAEDVLAVHTNVVDADANQQLLLAASRLNDLYMLLGNEAYADAMDPTIGFGSTMTINNTAVLPVDYGSLASSLFCFDNQVPTLLDEELSLLRGRGNTALSPGMGVSPVYNRLFWNYTKGITAGEVAYSVHYDITGHTNVIIDATTAKARFPQGHGDAWGYYLDALTAYYSLMRHPTFSWGVPSITPMLMNDLTIDADYFDEKKFAEAGAALARTGAEILKDTYRQSYDEARDQLFPGYYDSNTNRAWGVGQWGSRAGVGALCNWMVGNSLLPPPSAWLTNVAALALSEDFLHLGYGILPGSAYFDGDFTVEIWINPRLTGATADTGLLKFASSNGVEQVLIGLSGPQLSPTLRIFGATNTFGMYSSTPINTGTWSHVAVTLAGNLASIYVNGVVVTQVVGAVTPAAVLRTDSTVGWGTQDLEYFQGAVCELRIWDVARSAADIVEAMNRRLTGGEEGLAAYWPMNEGVSTYLLDRSHHGLTARAEGYTAWTDDRPALISNTDYDDPGIQKIDRSTVKALPEIAASLRTLQTEVDNADRGLNPLGLARTSIPFDIDPLDLDQGGSHFEQILARAETALKNAQNVFDAVQDANRILRQQQANANNFQAAAISQEADYKRRLIEIYGYPYSDDIGTGKTYPSGYDGPDLYHYMYVDMSALGWSGTEVEPIAARTYEFTGKGADSIMDPYGFATNEPPGELEEGASNSITFFYAANGLPCKPTIWTGARRAEGRLQIAYADFLKQLLSYRLALETYEHKTEYLNETFDWYTETYAPAKAWDYDASMTLQSMKEILNTYESVVKFKKILLNWRKNARNAKGYIMLREVPNDEVMGLADGGDIFAPVKAAILAANEAQEAIMSFKDFMLEAISIAGKWAVESAEYGTEMTKLTHDYKLERIQQETEITELARSQSRDLAAVKVAFQGMIQSYQNMVSIEQEGQRILGGRQRDRSETANRIASMRYSDMAFRIFRDDALSRYNSAFDLAAMYAYLAAKAYDYETGLLPTESSTDPGSQFLGDVVRARTIGRLVNGEPQVGGSIGEPGLADILARMKANWAVLDGRLGFNNPNWRQTWFSLRTELLRIVPGSAGDANWREALNSYKVDNLFERPEFRRYCIPFAAQGGLRATEPALVIPFSTTVDFGYNFFGRVLAGGDHAFSSSDFATKIRSIGIWFSNYGTNVVGYPLGLAYTPEAYLIPVGVDVMRSPSDLTGNTLRSWQVLDQAIPVPYEIGDTEINATDWIPLYDSLPGPLAALRRYNALGAYDDTGVWNSSRINYSSRLIGRSVWNSQWYLIIPAGSLNGARTLALDMFINGKNGDGNGVKDIKLLFETYSYSGN
jgi:hypothetical protein